MRLVNTWKWVCEKKSWRALLALKTFITVIALSEDTLSMVDGWTYMINIPIVNWLYAFLEEIHVWGIEDMFLFAGIAALYYLAKDHKLQKNRWVSGLSAFFSVCIIVGKSFSKTAGWDLIFYRKIQMALALIVGIGYYFLFKNTIILLARVLENVKAMVRVPRGNIETQLFEKHSFILPLIIIALSSLPILIFFFPGTVQWDAYAQILEYLGKAGGGSWDGQQPVIITWLIGSCISIGRTLFGSDSIGVFLYTGVQYCVQWLIFAYCIKIMCKLRAPMLLRWGGLLYFVVFPVWQIWGYTLVKDTGHYLFLLLFVLLWIDICLTKTEKVRLWKWILLAVSVVGITVSRNNGVHILLFVGVFGLITYKKEWRVYMICLLVGIGTTLLVSNVFMRQMGIEKGPVKEMLSIPIQQTARCVRDHYGELTVEETDILSNIFSENSGNLELLAKSYDPEFADPAKWIFLKDPSEKELKDFITVWLQLLRKYPGTCMEALVNHIYGYFYPNRESFWEIRGKYVVGGGYELKDEYMDISFAIHSGEVRKMYERGAMIFNNLPVVGMLYSVGMHTFLLLGCLTYLLAGKKYRAIRVLYPSVAVLLICLLSPVNAFLRYMLPVMVLLPINVAWCYCATHEEDS